MSNYLASFRVVGNPKAQPRVKAFRRGNHAGVYTPATAQGWKEAIKIVAMDVGIQGKLWDCPIELRVEFYLPRPKSRKKDTWVTTKPDLDNLDKSLRDALTDICVWRDDSQVVCGYSVKLYETDDEPPGCMVIIADASEAGK